VSLKREKGNAIETGSTVRGAKNRNYMGEATNMLHGYIRFFVYINEVRGMHNFDTLVINELPKLTVGVTVGFPPNR
jgi:hypothetical protein